MGGSDDGGGINHLCAPPPACFFVAADAMVPLINHSSVQSLST